MINGLSFLFWDLIGCRLFGHKVITQHLWHRNAHAELTYCSRCERLVGDEPVTTYW